MARLSLTHHLIRCEREHGLDPDLRLLLEVIARVNQELGTTAVVITHNASIAGMADRVIRLADGRIQSIECNEHKISPSELSW